MATYSQLAQTMPRAACSTLEPIKRSACTRMIISYVASRQWPSQRAVVSCSLAMMTSIVTCGTHCDLNELVSQLEKVKFISLFLNFKNRSCFRFALKAFSLVMTIVLAAWALLMTVWLLRLAHGTVSSRFGTKFNLH